VSTSADSHHVFRQQYADDTQLCVFLSPQLSRRTHHTRVMF